MDGDAAGLPLDLFSLAGQLVQLLAVDFHRRIHGRNLVDLPGELGQYRFHIGPAYGDGMFLQRLAGGVLGVGDTAQTQARFIALFRRFKKLHGPGGPAHKHRQNTGGHGVQGAAVANTLLVEYAPQLGRHVLGRPSLGLVHNDNAVCRHGHTSMPSARRASSTMARTSS